MRHELQYAIRQLRRNLGFSLAVISTLAVGLSAVIAVFSVAYGVLLRPLPIARPSELLGIYQTREASGVSRSAVSGARFELWRQSNDVFSGMTAAGRHTFELTISGTALRVDGELVTGNFFELLGVAPIHGRLFTSKDEGEGSTAVPGVIGESLWRQRFNGDPSVLGRTLLVGDVSLTIVGVVSDAFARWRYPARVWAPYRLTPTLLAPEILAGDGYRLLNAIGRLRPDVSTVRAREAMEALDRRVSEELGRFDPRWGLAIVPLRDLVSTPTLRRSLWLLFLVTIVVLFLATANVASLMLTRVMGRDREIATRLALGAGHGRIARQLLLESALLAVVGGSGALVLAWLAMPILIALAPAEATRASVIAMDMPVVAWSGVATLVALHAIVVLPMLRARRADVIAGLRGSRSAPPIGAGRAHALLIVTQVVVAVPVLAAAALLVTTVVRLAQVDPGFDPRHLVTMRVSLPSTAYPDRPSVSLFQDQLLERLAAVPGVEERALSTGLPLRRFGDQPGMIVGTSVEIEGGKRYLNGEETHAPFTPGRQHVTSGYFRTLGIPLLTGRDIAVSDVAGAPLVAVVNEAMARLHWPGEIPVGKRIRFEWPRPRGEAVPWTEIVGVVGDARHHRLDAPGRPEVYTALVQDRGVYRNAFIHARSRLAPDQFASALRTTVQSLDPRVPLDDVREVEALANELAATPRYSAALVALLGGVALLLAAIGVYGLGAFAVAQRTREIGIRIALGATRAIVIRGALLRGLVPALIGLVLGSVVAWMTVGLLSGLLYGVEASNPIVFAVAIGILMAAAGVAAYLPARRAARTDPLVALRTD